MLKQISFVHSRSEWSKNRPSFIKHCFFVSFLQSSDSTRMTLVENNCTKTLLLVFARLCWLKLRCITCNVSTSGSDVIYRKQVDDLKALHWLNNFILFQIDAVMLCLSWAHTLKHPLWQYWLLNDWCVQPNISCVEFEMKLNFRLQWDGSGKKTKYFFRESVAVKSTAHFGIALCSLFHFLSCNLFSLFLEAVLWAKSFIFPI